MHRLDKPWRTGLISQDATQLPNGHLEHRLTPRRLGPHGLQQGIFGDKLAGMSHQVTEERKRFGGQRQDLLVAPQTFVASV